MIGGMDVLSALGREIGALAARTLDLALPGTCAGCGREGAALCAACSTALDARLHLPPGTPIGLPGEIPEPLVQVEWCAPFGGAVRRALHRLKYAGERRLAEPLGAAVARRWARAGAGGDLLVPVPASPDRVRDRGYDQAALIARVAGAALGIPVMPLLERSRATTAQFDLDRAARAGNVEGVFRLAGAAGPAAAGAAGSAAAHSAGAVPTRSAGAVPTRSAGAAGSPLRLDGAWIVLVDDVLTTGATLTACARVLVAHGALAVSAVTVARER